MENTGIIKNIRQRARQRQRLIVLPEKDDARIQEAARIITKEKIARIILLGKEGLESKKIDAFAQIFFEARKHKGITILQAREALSHLLYYAAMMVRAGEADGFVAGAAHSTPDVAKAAIYCIGVDERIKTGTSELDTRLKRLEDRLSNTGVPEQLESTSSAREIRSEGKIKSKLIILRELVDDGVISEEDYDYKKAKMLGEVMSDMSIKEQLREIKDLRSEGLITEDDYNEKKKELLDQF